MTAATGNRVTHRRAEVDSGNLATQQRPNVDLMTADLDREDIVQAEDDIPALKKNYMADLKFNEDPVTIRITSHSKDGFAQKHIESWVNGKGAEVLTNGKFISVAYLPVNTNLTTKRKYVEQLMTSMPVNVKTRHDKGDVDQPRNWVEFESAASYSISIIRDDSPAGSDWAESIMYRRN